MTNASFESFLPDSAADGVSVSGYDYSSKASLSVGGDISFHAASTIKVAVLATLAAAVEEGRFPFYGRLHVRNRFVSAADGRLFRVAAGRDANAVVHAARGKTMRISELARHMIVTSSNLATNLLLDLIGVEYAREVLERAGVDGVDLKRGVEDDAAFEAGINNEVTADGLVALFRALLDGQFAGEELTQEMIDILAAQEFNSGIPAGLPKHVREGGPVAHKTGEISTVAHDAGIIFAPDRDPVVLAICTRWNPDEGGRMDVIAEATRRTWKFLTGNGDD